MALWRAKEPSSIERHETSDESYPVVEELIVKQLLQSVL